MILLISLLLLLAVLILGDLWFNHRHHHSLKQRNTDGHQQLTQLLELLKLLQKHRGLSVNATPANQFQRTTLKQQIEQLFSALNHQDYMGEKSEMMLIEQKWHNLGKPSSQSFSEHSILIEELLHQFNAVSDHAALAKQHQGSSSLINHVKFAENLARIRGLGSKAANLGKCPAPLRIQLLYLLDSLKNNPLCDQHSNSLINKVNTEILKPSQISLSAEAFFSEVTLMIDDHLELGNLDIKTESGFA